MNRHRERIRTGVGFMYNYEENCCTWSTALDTYCDYDEDNCVYYGKNRSKCIWVKDKNGVLVREWDIVRCSSWCPHEIKWMEAVPSSAILWWMPWFYLEWLRDGYSRMETEEVIWNIREKPDLLNKD